METWKALLGLAGILVVFGVFASITDVELSSPAGIGLFLGAIIASILFYVISRYGYRLGKNIGENMQDEE